MIELRDYQVDAVGKVRGEVARLPPGRPRRVLLQSETGSGKNVMALEPTRRCYEMGKRALFIARGRELVHQFAGHLKGWGIPHGVIMRGEALTDYPVQVASKDTFLSWALRRKVVQLPPADLLIVDECHESLAKNWRRIIESYPRAVVIGMSATPARADGRGLGDLYGAMVQAAPPSELIARGFLVPTRVFAPYRPDLKGVPTQNGDFQKKALRGLMDKAQLVGDIVGHWKELAGNRQTIVYATGVQHSMHICEEFRKAGIAALHVDGRTNPEERDRAIKSLMDGTVRVVCNCGVFVQGVDVPPVSCCVLACPTKSYVKFRQAVGRIKRPFDGKTDALVLDHAGCVFVHGMPDQDVQWKLEKTERVQDRVKQLLKDRPERQPVTCSQCHCVYSGLPACPNCGHVPKRRAAPKVYAQGKLQEVKARPTPTREDMQRYWRVCLATMANKGRRAGAAGHMFKRRFGCWPPNDFKDVPRGCQWQQEVAVLYPQYVRSHA